MQKGDGDAATWPPPNKGFRCEYVARQISMNARYSLWVTQAEHDTMAGILAGCPGQPAPNAVAPAAVYYANCTEVKAAGQHSCTPVPPATGPVRPTAWSRHLTAVERLRICRSS